MATRKLLELSKEVEEALFYFNQPFEKEKMWTNGKEVVLLVVGLMSHAMHVGGEGEGFSKTYFWKSEVIQKMME